MKRQGSFLLALCLALALLTGCQSDNKPETLPSESASSSVETEPTEAPEGEESSEGDCFLVDAADLFGAGGWFHFQMPKTGAVRLEEENFDYDGEAGWTYYVLEEEFEDALRYLPQANEETQPQEGTLTVEEGQWVYCQCSVNSFTESELDAGKLQLTLTLEYDQ